jgi:hypothetical protein
VLEPVALDCNQHAVVSLVANGGNTLWRCGQERGYALGKPEPFRLRAAVWRQAPAVTCVGTLPLHGLTVLGTDDGAVHLTQ